MLFNKDFNTTINFLIMSREEFLNQYSYLTSLEYDIFEDLFYQDLVNNIVNLYNMSKKQRKSLSNFYIACLQRFIKTLSEKRQKEIKQMINL